MWVWSEGASLNRSHSSPWGNSKGLKTSTSGLPWKVRWLIVCPPLGGWGVWERMDTCIYMAESLSCSLQTITTLLIDYTPIQNKKLKKKKKNPAANAGDTGLIPGLGRFYMLPDNQAHVSQLLKPMCLEPMLWNKRRCSNEKPTPDN